MSADLYLRALPDTEEYRSLLAFLDGVDYFGADEEHETRGEDGYWYGQDGLRGLPFSEWSALRERIEQHPRVWVGQVSWMKASLDNDSDFIPGPVREVESLMGSGGVMTPNLATRVMVAMNVPDHSYYSQPHVTRVDPAELEWHQKVMRTRSRASWARGWHLVRPNILIYRSRGVAKRQVVKRFLQQNMGKFVISESD